MGRKVKKSTIAQKKSRDRTNSFQGLEQSGSGTNGRLDSDGDTPMDGAAEDPWESGEQPTQYTLPQRKTTTRIRQCDEHDYYGILGLKKGCSLSDIRKAYRDLALRTHPDHNKFEDAEIAFKKLGQAYQVLRDPSKRKEFDAGRGRYDSGPSCDPHDVFGEEFAGNAAGPDTDDSLSIADEDSYEDSEHAPDEKVMGIYCAATPLVNKFLTLDDKTARKAPLEGIRSFNRVIMGENREADRPDESLLINVELLTGFRIEYSKAVQQLQRDPTNPTTLSSIKRIQQQFNHTMKGYGYPPSWQLPPPPDGLSTQGAGGADQAEKIIGYSPNKNPSRIRFIVKKPDEACGIQIGNRFDVGSDAAKAYMLLPEAERKDIRYSEGRYNRNQMSNYKQILGWTNDLGKTPLESRRALPTGYGLVQFRDNTTDILTRTALRNLLGQGVADNEIDKFYSDRQMVPPWAYMPSVRRLQGPEWARIKGNPPQPPTNRRGTNISTAPGSGLGSKPLESQNGFEQVMRMMEENQKQTRQLVETLVQAVAHLSVKAA